MPISTRLHGWIDYAAAVSLGGLVLAGGLRGPARGVAAVATAVPVGVFLLQPGREEWAWPKLQPDHAVARIGIRSDRPFDRCGHHRA